MNQPRETDVVVQRALDLHELVVELLLQARQQHHVAAREEPFEQRALVLRAAGRSCRAGELPVGVAEPVLLGDLLDHEVLAHRQVDDRRGDVERSRDLVDERADLPGAQVVGRRVLDRTRSVVEEADGGARAGRVAEDDVGGAADVTAVAADPPHEQHERADEHARTLRWRWPLWWS